MDCLFCRIVAEEIPAHKVYEDEDVLAFYDINPVAPVHVLIIPKKHICSLIDAEESDFKILGKILRTAAKVAEDLGLSKDGFRVINNVGTHGGQTVFHVHFHLIGGRQLSWPPG